MLAEDRQIPRKPYRVVPVVVRRKTLSLAKVLKAKQRLVRWVLCGPVVFFATVLVMMGMAFWLPAGAAGVDHIALPVLLFPLIWAGLFFYALIEDNPLRAVSVLTGLIVLHLGLLLLNMR